MWSCPVCDTENEGAVCRECGYDPSADLSLHPSFCVPVRLPEPISALRAKRLASAPMSERECDLTRRLIECYRREIARVIEKPGCSYDRLLKCAGEFCDLPGATELWNMIREKAKSILTERAGEALRQMSRGEAPVGEHTRLYLVLQAYADFGRRMMELLESAPQGGEILGGLRSDYADNAKAYIQRYDRDFRFRFDAARIREYDVFYNKDFRGMDLLNFGRTLLRIYREAEGGNLRVLRDYAEHKPAGVANIDWGMIRKSLYAYWADAQAVRRNRWMAEEVYALRTDPNEENIRKFVEKDTSTLRFWTEAAAWKNQKTISLMLDKDSAIVRTKGRLELSLKYNRSYWTAEMIRNWLYDCQLCMDAGVRGVQPIRDLLEKSLEELSTEARPRNAEARQADEREWANAARRLEIDQTQASDWEHEQEPAGKKKNSEPEDWLHNRIRNFFKR